jgi:hypothetical protein
MFLYFGTTRTYLKSLKLSHLTPDKKYPISIVEETRAPLDGRNKKVTVPPRN